MAAKIKVQFNPMDLSDCREVEVFQPTTIFGWLKEEYPLGFGRPIRLLLNGEELPLEESDYALRDGDVVQVLVSPAEIISTTALVAAAIAAAASIAASLVVYLIFGRPKKPGAPPEPDPVYSLQGGQNMVRLGEPIPVIYGRVITYPDAITPPYSYFENNEQYIAQILCIGQGEFNISEVLISDTPVSALGSGVVSWRAWNPAQHQKTMGTIEAATGIFEMMVTSVEVLDQEFSGVAGNPGGGWDWIEVVGDFIAPDKIKITSSPIPPTFNSVAISVYNSQFNNQTFNVAGYDAATGTITVTGPAVVNEPGVSFSLLVFGQTPTGNSAGPFVTCNPGFRGDLIQCDFVFPGGLFKLDSKGRFTSETVNLTITAQPIDDNNANAGTPVIKNVTITRSTNTPQRITESFQVPMGRYHVTVTRSTPPAPDSKTQNTFNWVGLKFKLEKVTRPVYGDTTLISVKIKATNGISSDAANKFRVRCTRRLLQHGSGTLQGTRSPADAYIDAVTNKVYGAGRSLASIDVAGLIQAEQHWGAEGLFDGIFSSRVTLWDALSMILQGVAAAPIRRGAHLGLVQDGKKLPAVQMFSDANIIADTFEASYGFDRPGQYAGYQVEYRDPQTFNAAYVQYPAEAVDLETVTLFGCTSKPQAEKFARLLWNRRLFGRQNISFDTELEGFIAEVGKRILVSTNAVQWGESGQVIRTIGSEILLDRSVDLSQYSNPVMVLRSEQGVPSSPFPVTQGSSPRHVTLGPGPFPVPIIDIMESKVGTQWAIGDNQKRIRDFVVQSIQHRGRNVTTVSGAIYDERLYDGTFTFQGVPV